jgi:hypothetical protein
MTITAAAVRELPRSRANPDIVRGYHTVDEAGKKSILLGAKIREPIALAVAITVQCDG